MLGSSSHLLPKVSLLKSESTDIKCVDVCESL